MRGAVNIVIGLVFVAGGLTGQLSLIGTNSGPALAVVGGLLAAYGVRQAMVGSAESEAAE